MAGRISSYAIDKRIDQGGAVSAFNKILAIIIM